MKIGEFGFYDVILRDDGKSCDPEIALGPVDDNLALLYSFLCLLGLGIVFQVVMYFERRRKFQGIKRAFKNFQKELGFEVIRAECFFPFL